jgi:hypothetical protein
MSTRVKFRSPSVVLLAKSNIPTAGLTAMPTRPVLVVYLSKHDLVDVHTKIMATIRNRTFHEALAEPHDAGALRTPHGRQDDPGDALV